MKIGVGTHLTYYNLGIVDFAKKAEAVGFESLWIGEHTIIPVKQEQGYLLGGDLPEIYRHMPDPFIWLTAAAVATTTLRLGFDICLLPQRNPLITAKQLACLDLVSGGRVTIGVGAGWMEDEAVIMGVDFKRRWKVTEECIRAIKTLWSEEEARFEGEFIRFPPVYLNPKPIQKPNPPILIGAGSPDRDSKYALQRVAAIGDGWLPVYMSPDRIHQDLETLKTLCDKAGRDFDKLDITLVIPGSKVSIGEPLPSMGTIDIGPVEDPVTLIRRYEDAGVHRLIIALSELTVEAGPQLLERAAEVLQLSVGD